MGKHPEHPWEGCRLPACHAGHPSVLSQHSISQGLAVVNFSVSEVVNFSALPQFVWSVRYTLVKELALHRRHSLFCHRGPIPLLVFAEPSWMVPSFVWKLSWLATLRPARPVGA